ncbi:MAG: hypothetical protein NVS4B2_32890 [Chloroflexota bacterium]
MPTIKNLDKNDTGAGLSAVGYVVLFLVSLFAAGGQVIVCLLWAAWSHSKIAPLDQE